jgi:hypothetical protein
MELGVIQLEAATPDSQNIVATDECLCPQIDQKPVFAREK